MTVKRLTIPMAIIIFTMCAFALAIASDTDTDTSDDSAAKKVEVKVAVSPVIDSTTSATTRYLPVKFDSHDAHTKDFGLSCTSCHHDIVSVNEKTSPCSTCHDKADAKVSMKDAMHKSCVSCHREYKKKNGETSCPTGCLDCHTERK